MMAMNPQITQSYARGEYDYMHKLVNTGARFSFYLLLLLSLPIIVNADFILHLWLKKVPNNAVEFTQLTLVAMMITALSRPLITAQNATGNVRNYQLVVGGVELLNLPLSYVCLYVGLLPTSVIVVSIIVSFLSLGARLYMLPFTLEGFSRMGFFKQVILTCFVVGVISFFVPAILYQFVPKNFGSFVLNVLVCLIYSSLVIYFVGCNMAERHFILSRVEMLKRKF
jgi:Na+-driven multidrug efflux pump